MNALKKILRSLTFPFLSAKAVHTRLMLPGSNSSRVDLLRRCGAAVGEGSRIYHGLIIVNAHKDFSNLAVGGNVYVGHGVVLDLKDRITVEDGATISMGVRVATHTDVGYNALAGIYPPTSAPVVVKAGAFIGTAATILEGVTVGAGSVVAAGAVVTADVPASAVAAGVPASVIKMLEAG